MRVIRPRPAAWLLVGLLVGTPSWAGAPAAKPLALTDPAGQALLFHSRARADYLPLAETFLTQANLAYCGAASAVMVLNSLALPAPETPGYGPYRFWTQDNLFSAPAARAAVAPETVAKQGMTLAELAGLLAANGATVQRWHGDELSLPQFRGLLNDGLRDPADRLLVNYHRSALGQQGGGHISPLAAYDERRDRVLILDVARYRYPSVWVPTESLWQAIRMVDSSSGRSRGLLRVSAPAAAPSPAPPPATPRSGP
ncbi:MAG: phytochelatin synthase family protein [Cyanobium sp.]